MSGMIEGWKAPEVHRDGGERRERHRLEAVVGVVTFERRVDVSSLHDFGESSVFDHARASRHR